MNREPRGPGNAVMLLALALALGSDLGMQGEWLEQGDLRQLTYQLHLLSWLLVALALALHLSMVQLGWLERDAPGQWPGQISAWWQRRFRQG
jgi:hypothetical protein